MQEKKALREEKMQQEEKYMWAIVDGVKEKVTARFDCASCFGILGAYAFFGYEIY